MVLIVIIASVHFLFLIDLNSCRLSPCKNQGTCLNSGPGEFRCVCVDGYTGRDCGQGIEIAPQCFCSVVKGYPETIEMKCSTVVPLKLKHATTIFNFLVSD